MVGEDKVKASFGCCEKSGGETVFTTIALPLTSPFQLPHHVTAMQHCTASPAPVYREEGEEEREKDRKKENESMNYDRLLSVSLDTPPPHPHSQHKHECVCERERARAPVEGTTDCVISPLAQNLSH